MATRKGTHPHVAIQPGGYLVEEIGARSISQKELVESVKRPVTTVNEIINTQRS